jgi:hypothetical protein
MQYPPDQNRQGQPSQPLPPYQQPMYPGQFQPPPYPPRSPYIPPPSSYSGRLLVALAIMYILSLLFVFIEAVIGTSIQGSADSASAGTGILSGAAVVLLLVLHGIIIVKDGHNFFTLFGKLQWRGMKGWLKFVLVLVYLCMWIMTGIYLVQAKNHFLRTRQQSLGQAVRHGWLSYREKTRRAQLMIGIGVALLLIAGITFTSVGAMVDRANMLSMLTPTTNQPATNGYAVTPTPAQNLVATSVPTATPTPKPSPTPKPTPTPVPTQRPTPTPTAKPTPTPAPACVAVNNNPWCYNFTPGNLIYYPPSGFCNYFPCIASFYEPDDPGDGYIVECNDGSYSQSGGERGACSYHGGVMRPLYSH